MVKVIAVDFGGTNIRVALVVQGNIKAKVQLATEAEKGKKVSLHNLLMTIHSLYTHDLKAICVGGPAPMDIQHGVFLGPRNLPGWEKVKLREIIERMFHVPCSVNNDANCFALGEALYGVGKGHKTVAGIILGTGLGLGVVIDKKIHAGHSSAAGEIGRIPYKSKQLEQYCSGSFFNKHPRTVEEAALKGDKQAKQKYEDYGKHVAIAVQIVVNTIDPEIIVLGGGVSNAYPLFKKTMLQELKKRLYPLSFKKLKIVKSELKDAALLGAAALA